MSNPQNFEDDGRVISSMETTERWYDRALRRRHSDAHQGDQLTSSESRRFTMSALLAGLLIALVFSVTWILFTIFCTQIWFR